MSPAESTDAPTPGIRLRIRGGVQGVGFRPWVWREACALGVRGVVRNVANGVEIRAFASPETLDAFRASFDRPPSGASIEAIECEPLMVAAPPTFEISESDGSDAESPTEVALAPDLPTCEACLVELDAPDSRRRRFPFIACAECGPRYTIARALPYDRERTAMADFPLCPACAVEYRDPGDRRFHAESSSCPACGPVLRALSLAGEEVREGDDALAHAVEVLLRGGVVAIHGIGGFHLACDATDERAVARLRTRKRRAAKAFAVMVGSVDGAEKHAWISADERALLSSPVRPVLLLRRRGDSSLASGVAPGSPLVGLFLPYTPLHVLLLGDFSKPLVMTSANLSGEPIAYRLGESFETLAMLTDAILTHDREVVAPCDDSVVLSSPSGPVLLRRSRGYVPRPIRLARSVARPVLACGGQWSNTICLAEGERAWLSAHIGDLDSPMSAKRLRDTALRWRRWLGIDPEVVACDLHRGYESTSFAEELERDGAELIRVQHHHAHMASVLAEHHVDGPALGLIWDGTGDGGDGSAWGSELLLGDLHSCRRLATFRPLPLAGGERAIREPWRLALALLDDAFDRAPPLDAIALFAEIDAAERERVRALISNRDLCADAHGVGRYFDAVGALLLMRRNATFQGELALGLNHLCIESEVEPYPFVLERDEIPWRLDLRPAVRALVEDMIVGIRRGAIAARFHATLVHAGAVLVDDGIRFASKHAHDSVHEIAVEGNRVGEKRPIVVLGGGCFQNPILLSGLEGRLADCGRVLRPNRLSPGDGGLALGQAAVANAIVSRREVT